MPLFSVPAVRYVRLYVWVSVKHKDSLSETALAHAPLRDAESITTVTNSVIPPWWGWITTASFTFTDSLADISWHQGPVRDTCMRKRSHAHSCIFSTCTCVYTFHLHYSIAVGMNVCPWLPINSFCAVFKYGFRHSFVCFQILCFANTGMQMWLTKIMIY